MSARDEDPFDDVDEEGCPCGLMGKNDCAGECGWAPDATPAITELDEHLRRTPPHPYDGDEVPDDLC